MLTSPQVEPSTMLFRNKVSPYQGKTLRGVVRETWLRGQQIFTREDGFHEKAGPAGELLLEPRKNVPFLKSPNGLRN
jgi:allantoinase